ncbi:hypothetical protein D3C71_1897430 [compost metagenome]
MAQHAGRDAGIDLRQWTGRQALGLNHRVSRRRTQQYRLFVQRLLTLTQQCQMAALLINQVLFGIHHVQ